MKKFKIVPRLYAALYLRKKSAADRVGFGRAVHQAIGSNPTLFVNPSPSLNDQKAITDDLEAKINAAATGGEAEKSALAEAMYHFDTMIINVASYVESIANSNPLTAASTLSAAGFMPSKTKEKSPIPDAVTKLFAIYTNEPSVLIKWRGAKYARAYEVYVTAAPNDADSWILAETTAGRKLLVGNLESCKRYYFKIISIGVWGRSVESNMVSCVTG